ncbi:formyltransferase family protein [Streptomyces sp. NPDC127033]|uniref:formyltransferase family protein n=1 Tax=Streptomyces sp. NPDC127033 TaxID=3347110 RepID=UPI0036504279
MLLKVAVLASHTGSNLHALTSAAARPYCSFAVALVISSNSTSGALAHTRELGIPALHLSGRTHPEPDQLDHAMLAALREHRIGLVVTAGYMKKIGPVTLNAYAGHILNIHPSLLPRHGGPGMRGRSTCRRAPRRGRRIVQRSGSVLPYASGRACRTTRRRPGRSPRW